MVQEVSTFGRAAQARPKARFGKQASAAGRSGPHEDVDEDEDSMGADQGNAHLLPKVMVPFRTRPGETPRKVKIQRQQRLFAAQDVAQLVAKEGMPDAPRPSVLALDAFDNTEFESRLPAGWVPRTAGVAPTPARVAVQQPDGAWAWQQCEVVGYDDASGADTYLVRMVGADGGAAGECESVPRVRLHFGAEDPFVFARRFTDAHASRARAESLLRYNLYVDSMPLDDLPPLTSEQINRMLGFALNSKRLRDKLMDTSQLISEVNMEYARTMNKVIFDETLKRGSSGCPAPLVALPEVFPADARRPAPSHGTVQLPSYDFPQTFSEFSFRSLNTKGEVIGALGKVKAECTKVSKMSLFATNHTKSLRLDEFEQGQVQDVGKGWYNLHESNMETYEFSKLRRFLALVRFHMEDTMRSLVGASLARYTAYVSAACASAVTIHSTSHVELEGSTGLRAPLLVTELQISKDASGFTYATPLDAVVPKFGALFDLAVQKLQGLPQLEPAVMESLFWAVVPMLNAVHPLEEFVQEMRASLVSTLGNALGPVAEYLQRYEQYAPLLKLNPEAYVAELEAKGEDLTLSEVCSEIRKHSAELATLTDALPVHGVSVGLVYVQTAKTRDMLLQRKAKLVSLLKLLVARVPRKMMSALDVKFKEIERQLRAKTTSLEDVDEQRKYIEALPQKLGEIYTELELAKPWYDALEGMRHLLPDDEARDKANGDAWPAKLQRLAERQLDHLADDEKAYKEEMQSEQESYNGTIGDLSLLVSTFQQHTDLTKMDAVVVDVTGLMERLKKADSDAALYNGREALLGLPLTDYSAVKKTIDAFEPFALFWNTASTWKKNVAAWMDGSWEKLDGEAVERDVNNAFKVLYKQGKVFSTRGLDKCSENCEAIRTEVEDFKKFVPLVQALRNPGMRDRHWDGLSTELGLDVHPDSSFTLAKAEEQGLLSHLETITRVSDVAGKEFSIEQALDKMQGEWAAAEMGVLEYRETGTYVIKVEEQITQMLDDHIVMTQSMTFSPYKKSMTFSPEQPFEERILKWEAQLNLVSEILDQWIAVQRNWMYLEPIFSSDDIMQQLPLEGKRFATVDRMWRKATETAKRAPALLTVCSSQKLLDQFIEANKLLESVQKGLSDYLETKRLAFARFFFLSNDELLQILSQSKNPLAVQPHLRKCFEAIESLDFADDLEISAMNSKEKEKVPFDKPMYPQGNVEVWLGEVESRMRSALRQQIVDSIADYKATPRPEWVRRWPAMVVLAVSVIFWSQECESAIEAGEMPAYAKTCSKDLLDLTDLVRGEISNQDRTTLGALITVDVHARDVVDGLAAAGGKLRVSDFEWVSQLRYYWRDDVFVDMVQASISYGYEYLGNSPRLVITPLTDRCYMTLMSAMHLNLGGAPAGPAGTGKTETTKDLAKALAKQCVVFNCSDGLDYMAMGKFLKGG
ncbi:hypothetical protein FOA52_006209 [Chlamydomonas sp. UWO 241]|nr:hypothetical protein FOA52_006209 [Chlamydomonas sp. UWO 241]